LIVPGDRDVAAIDDVLDEIALSAAGIWSKTILGCAILVLPSAFA
jgi:hypothetical protein